MGSSQSKQPSAGDYPAPLGNDVQPAITQRIYPSQDDIAKQQQQLYQPHSTLSHPPSKHVTSSSSSGQSSSSSRPSVTDSSWEFPKDKLVTNKDKVPLPVDLAVSLGKTVASLGSFLYPSYLTFRALERKDHNEQVNMLMFWTVNSAVQGLVAFSDIWLHHYIGNEMVYTLTSTGLKLMPTILGPDRVYKLYIKPFYRHYVESEAEKLLAEADKVKKKALSEVAQFKQQHGLDDKGSDKKDQSSSSSASSSASQQPAATTIDQSKVSPAIDAIDRRMLAAAQNQVQDLDRQQSYTEADTVTLRPSSVVPSGDPSSSVELSDNDLIAVSPSNKAEKSKCGVQ